MAHPAGLALDGGDDARLHAMGAPTVKKLHDPSVTFEEYIYYARREREREKTLLLDGQGEKRVSFTAVFGKRAATTTGTEPASPIIAVDQKSEKEGVARPEAYGVVGDDEWYQAARSLRTATWGAVFYLMTTDVLGPYSVPWALSQMGYGPGVTLYTVFGALAGYAGWQIWTMFLRLDSAVYPLKSYGDLAYRIYGPWARHLVNLLQSVQLIFNVGIIVLQNGQGLYQINSHICYIACCTIWATLGMLLGQIRTLSRFRPIATLAICLNVTVMILTMATVSHSPPNYPASLSSNARGHSYGPIATYAGKPPYNTGFQTNISGLMQAVYSYGGSLIFCEFLSEMRRPADFWKSLLLAQAFIYIVYLFFGLFVYSYHGEFVVNPAFQGLSPQGALKAGNILGLTAALIAGGLYSNIGIKTIYANIGVEVLGAPTLDRTSAKVLWVACVPVYWGCAFLLAAAIPNFSYLSGLVAAVCILQFTYTFPPLLMLGCDVQLHAIREGEGFDPVTGGTVRRDEGWKRGWRGARTYWYVNAWNAVFCLGALVTAALGIYSSVEGLRGAFKSGTSTSFSCKGPLGSG